jgi:serine/threonine-protein kinase
MVPFRGETAVAVAYQHVSERPQAPSTHNGEISAPLDRVVLHALAKDRNRRFQTASEFRDALRQAAAGIMPKLSNDDEQSSVLFNTSEDISESDLALRRLSETGGSTRSQSRPPVMWVWASILTIVAVIAAVAFWVASMAPSSLIPANSREIPKFAGIEQSVAIKQLLDLDLQPVVEEITDDDTDAGDVVRTDPAAGELVAIDTTVTVFVSIGPENPKVPSFDRMSLEEYTVAVEALGLTVGSVSNADDPTAPEGRVLQVAPEPGAALKRGDAIGVTVSTGMVKIPDVKGQSLEVARNLLEGLASVTPEPRGDCATSPGFPVIEQSMMGQQAQGSEITLAYCSG